MRFCVNIFYRLIAALVEVFSLLPRVISRILSVFILQPGHGVLRRVSGCRLAVQYSAALVRFVQQFVWLILVQRLRVAHRNLGHSYLAATLDHIEFENMFKDSGYWDYCILVTYDVYFRLYGVYSLFFISDFSVVEKASWRGVGSMLWPLNQVFFLELRNLNEFFAYVISWVITTLCSL